MAEDKAVKKAAKPEASREKAVKDVAKMEPQALTKTGKLKAVVAAAPSEVAIKAPSEIQVKPQAPKAEAKDTAKTEPAKPEASTAEARAEAPKAEAKSEAKKELDPSKEFVDDIMAEMSLKGASKKRLIRKLAEQYNFDKQKVLFRLRRALITERYAAAHAEAGH